MSMQRVSLPVLVLLLSGDLCPKCGWGTRNTSKRWARCKKCNQRVPRKDMEDVCNGIKKKIEGTS